MAVVAFAIGLVWTHVAWADGDADASPDSEDDHAFNQIRLLASASSFSGTELVGIGSVGRYRMGGGSLELDAERFFGPIGVGIHVQGFAADKEELLFVRGEAAFGVPVASWGGAVPGGAALFVGLGGDLGRYWYAEEGRLYGQLRGRLRFWLSRDVPLQISYAAVPGIVATPDAFVHEHRIELATGWKLLAVGSRFGFAFAHGGAPEQLFWQQEIGVFLGLGVL